ncbi:MAG: ABC transporter permease [Bacteroidetes bacterium]|jgi:lipoprotein-releasing system permease protein|nr:ABC transporter permease [Bacteroidota bacterium]MDA1210693.1 ABC transporter permease [Bacteroidota bacterium]
MGRLPYFIAKRYLLAKHSRHAVGLLSRIAIGAVAVATFSLFLVLSGFTGLKDYALAFTNIFDSDLIISPVSGKSFIYDDAGQKALQGLTGIQAVGRVVEDKVFLRYKNQARVATLRGIDSAYTGVTPVDTLVYTGNWFSPERPEVVLGYSVAADLALAARDFSNLIQISAPIPGSNIMAATSPDQVFRSEQVVASGIYEVNDQVNDRFVFCSIETARYLFGWERNQVSSLVIKTASNDLEALKAQISSVFDDKVRVKTRVEQNAALYRMLNSENLFTYLFISLIAAIAVFNLTGTLIMLVLEKKNNLRTLFTLGQPLADIKRTFFASGLMMCGAGLALGLILGVLVVLGQSTFGWVLITETLPYPVTLTWGNFFLVAGTILGLGMLASLLGAQRVTRRLLD